MSSPSSIEVSSPGASETTSTDTRQPSRSTSGKGGGKGRGKGRGKVGKRGPPVRGSTAKRRKQDSDTVEPSVVDESQQWMKDYVQNMKEDEVREVLMKVMREDPRVMLHVLKPAERQPGGWHPPPGSNTPDWCTCGHCRQMPTELERKCCGKVPCVSCLLAFSRLILHEEVLALARLYRRNILVLDDEVDLQKANRHQAYRQFILWTYGRLGAGDRRVIPSCCVWKIRDKFPDQFGQYKGFLATRLG